MKNNTSIVLFLFLFIAAAIQLAEAQQPAYQDDDLSPELFSLILKEEWEYLRNATEQLDKETGIRGEFETTPEFQARAAKARRTALEKLNGHIKENKLDKRIFGVWFALKLETYNADAGIYSVTCPTLVEAPYDIPTVICSVPHNQYIEMADSIRGGIQKGVRSFQVRSRFQMESGTERCDDRKIE